MIYFTQRGVNRKSGSMKNFINHKSWNGKESIYRTSDGGTEIETMQMLAASAENIPVGGDGNGGSDALSNDRRGDWGNLWNKK